jgi:hypothetical protein
MMAMGVRIMDGRLRIGRLLSIPSRIGNAFASLVASDPFKADQADIRGTGRKTAAYESSLSGMLTDTYLRPVNVPATSRREALHNGPVGAFITLQLRRRGRLGARDGTVH